MKLYDWSNASNMEKETALKRSNADIHPDIQTNVQTIMRRVRQEGDPAILDYTSQFDHVTLSSLKVPYEDLKSAWDSLDGRTQTAIRQAKNNIETFHKAQKPALIQVETMPGVICQRRPRPIQNVGLYVPGGTAPLVSTLLMLAIPARIAGCPNRVIVTPPNQYGEVNPIILASAYLCDATHLFKCGGAQAIAALTYGTQTLPKCDKIFGPGNIYVAMAKSLAAQEIGGPAIDLPAGPSEVMVVADETADPVFIASDLLSQAEHDIWADIVCISSTRALAKKIELEVDRQLESLPRYDIAKTSLKKGRMIIAEQTNDVLKIINEYAPEHLIIQTQNPQKLSEQVDNSGSIFLGPWTPEAAGDYASGTNHTLPTFGSARAYSGVTLESFYKYISIQEITPQGLQNLGPTIEILADLEGLEAHKRAISLRLESLKNG